MRQLRGHGAPVRAIAFSPDGRTLVSGSDDGSAIIWDATGLVGVSAGPLPAAWEDLADADPLIARRAVWQLAAASGGAAVIGERVSALGEALKRVDRRIAELDDDRFAVRHRATRELAGLGDLIAPTLRKVLSERLPPERQRRVERLLNDCAPDGDVTELNCQTRRWLRCIEVLERRGDADARALLTTVISLSTPELADEARAVLRRLGEKLQ
jgi:WD40 repeat protein